MREKLIDVFCSVLGEEPDYQNEDANKFVDDLIANGVTVTDNNVGSKWIPVTERLPEMRDDGFADAFLVTNGCVGHIAYFVDGEWIFTENGEMKEPMFYDVTHWMPLPTPPNTEEFE